MNPMQKSLLDCSRAIFSKEIRPTELCKSVINANEKANCLNLYISTCNVAKAQEFSLSIEKRMNSEDSKYHPILSSIPISIKDNFMTLGLKTTAASQMLANFDSIFDADPVEKLRKNSAFLANKSNMDEFGMGSSTGNSSFGRSMNPIGMKYDELITKITPGGSSGGGAAAVAANYVHGAIGSDTGGSVRQPASFCGIVGFKPTNGRISRHGLIAYASSLDTPGIMSKTVSDAAVLFDVMRGDENDSRDPLMGMYRGYYTNTESGDLVRNSVSRDLLDAPEDLSCVCLEDIDRMIAKSKELVSLKGVRVGIPKELIVNEIDAEIMGAWQRTIDLLEDAGATVVNVSIPTLKHAIPAYYVIACAEASSNLSRFDGVRYGHRAAVSSYATRTESVGADEDEYAITDPLLQQIAKSRGEAFGNEVIQRIISGTYVLSRDAYEEFYGKANAIRSLMKLQFHDVFNGTNEIEGVDCLLCPTSPVLPHAWDKPPSAASSLVNDLMTVPANMAGIPAVNLPVLESSEVNFHGNVVKLPIGMQLFGSWYNEASLFRIALGIEQRSAYKGSWNTK